MKIQITKLYRSFNDSNGKPFLTKDGRNYERVAIQVKEFGSNWLTTFGAFWNKNWQEGDIIDDVEVEKVEKNGRTFYNLRRLDRLAIMADQIETIYNWVQFQQSVKIERKQIEKEEIKKAIGDNEIPVINEEEEQQLKDIPF